MLVAQYIPKGHDNAVSRELLSAVTKMPDREVRKAIAQDIQDGAVILNSGNGYFQYSGKGDYLYLAKTYLIEKSRAEAVRQRANALRRALNNAQKDKGYINTNES